MASWLWGLGSRHCWFFNSQRETAVIEKVTWRTIQSTGPFVFLQTELGFAFKIKLLGREKAVGDQMRGRNSITMADGFLERWKWHDTYLRCALPTCHGPWGLVLVDVSCGNGSVPIGQPTTCCLLVTREFWDPLLQIYLNDHLNEKYYFKKLNKKNNFLNSINIVFYIICILMIKNYLEKSFIF